MSIRCPHCGADDTWLKPVEGKPIIECTKCLRFSDRQGKRRGKGRPKAAPNLPNRQNVRRFILLDIFEELGINVSYSEALKLARLRRPDLTFTPEDCHNTSYYMRRKAANAGKA